MICKLVMYINYVSQSASHWFLVALCFERFCALIWPLHSRSRLTPRNAARACLIILALCVVLCAPVLVVFGERTHTTQGANGIQGILEQEELTKSTRTRTTCEVFSLLELGNSARLWAALVAYVTTAQKYAYSSLLTLVLTAAIAIKLLCIRLRFRREHATAVQRPTSFQNSGLQC